MPRTRTPDNLRPVPLSTYLPPELSQALRAMCEAKGWTTARAARAAIRHYLKAKGYTPANSQD